VGYVRRRPRRHRGQVLRSAISGSLGLRVPARQTHPIGEEAQVVNGSRLFSGLLFLLLAVLLFYLFVSYDFYVYGADVVGADHLGHREVFQASKVDEMSVFYIRPAEVEARLEKLLWVKEARVRCGFPNRVRITLRERKVAFVWRRGDTTWAVDADGRLLLLNQTLEDVLAVEDRSRPSEERQSPAAGLDEEVIASVLAAKDALPEASHLIYDPDYGLVFQSARGYEVRLGQGQVAYKAAIWRALEAELVARGIQPAHVDIRFAGSPCYGLGEASAASTGYST
jgi:cell division septal protein FtsQ